MAANYLHTVGRHPDLLDPTNYMEIRLDCGNTTNWVVKYWLAQKYRRSSCSPYTSHTERHHTRALTSGVYFV